MLGRIVVARRMRRISTLGLMMIGVLALSVVTAGTAAAAQKLDLTWFHESLAEHHQEALNETFNVVIANRSFEDGSFSIAGSPGYGTLTCDPGYASTGWVGLSKTNNKATDQVDLQSAAGMFAGEGECSNTGGLGATAKVNFNPDGATLNLGATGKASVVAKYATEPITLSVAYSGSAVCNYAVEKLVGALALVPYDGEWNQLSVSLTNAPLKRTSGSGECSKKAYVSAVFGFSTNPNHESFSELNGYYIFGHLG